MAKYMILGLISWKSVEWKKPFIRLPKEGMEIDFGGFGKEYAADRARATAIKLGVQSALINLSGDVAIIGPRADGTPWSVGITHPRIKGGVITSLPVERGGVATSGDYERYFELGGKRYSHILNPKTGMPIHSFQSVTVISESCLVAGSLTTLAMLKGEEEGLRMLREAGVKYYAITADAMPHYA